MKTRGSTTGSRGFATLIVILVVALMATYVVLNTRTLSGTKRALDALEKQQLRKFEQPARQVTADRTKP